MKQLHYDAVVIGFGKAGKTLAGKLGMSGKKVALIEKDAAMYGGTCINVGCIPSKSLIVSASNVPFSASEGEKDAMYRAAIEEKRRLTAMLRQKNYDKLNNLENVTILNGQAKFVGEKQVEVTLADETLVLFGDKIFVNTGAIPRIPPIEGLNTTRGVMTSTELMDLPQRPQRLTIIGGGYVGLEFASMYANFGSKVTVLQDGDVFLPREDEDISALIQEQLEAQGVQICKQVKTLKAEEINGCPVLTVEEKGALRQITSDAVLVATGRMANTQSLNCAAADIELTPYGTIKVDGFLRTTAPDVWAMGDVAGSAQHTYVSLDDARIVWGQLSGQNNRTTETRQNVPYSVFLATPYARVGMNEQEILQSGKNVRIAKLPVMAIPKAQVLKAPQGMLKALIDADTDEILGAMLLCPESYEMINVVKMAMDAGIQAKALGNTIFTHPTMTEALNDLFA